MTAAFTPPKQPVGTNQNDLTMNFVNAPLDQVLAYLSDAAGFIIVQQTRVSGYVTVQGTHITKEEAVNLLNSRVEPEQLRRHPRRDRTLTIMAKSDAQTGSIPVMMGNDPTNIPNNDEIATWIIPIRFVEARQLVSDLSLFVSPQATIVANEAGNSIVITDTQANIRHLAEIIQAVDNSAEAETEIRVFRLQHASPMDVATELSSMFPSSSSGSQAPIHVWRRSRWSRRRRRRSRRIWRRRWPWRIWRRRQSVRGPFGGGGGNATEQRIQKATQVTAVADSRIQAVIVTAPKDLMDEIARHHGRN